MAKMGQEQAVPATREIVRRVSDALDFEGTTVLQKELANFNNVAVNQLHDLLQTVAEELGC